jgi:hypothetical protein
VQRYGQRQRGTSCATGKCQQAEAPTGWIELGPQQYHEIGVGSEIPGWGRVTEVRDDRLVVEQPRTEDEKQRLQDQGALVYDVLELHILREDLRNPHSPSPRGSHP